MADVSIHEIRERIFKIHKDIDKYCKDLKKFSEYLATKSTSIEHKQDTEIMKAAYASMELATNELLEAKKWIDFMVDHGIVTEL